MSLTDSAKKYENSKINGVNIQDGGTLSKAIQDMWKKKAHRMSGSHGCSIKKDQRSIKEGDQLAKCDSFTSNFEDVFDSPKIDEIPEDYRVSHPYKIPQGANSSNPYIQRTNINTLGGQNPFFIGSKDRENVEKIVNIIVDTPDGTMSNRNTPLLNEKELPLTPLRACKPRKGRTPSIKLHTPDLGKCISLAHSRPLYTKQQQENFNSPMPRTNPKCARFSSKRPQPGTPYRYPGDGEQSPIPSSSDSFKPLHQQLCRSNTETGSLYQMEEDGAEHSDGSPPTVGVSLEKSFNLVDTSPETLEHLLDLKTKPAYLGSIFATSNTSTDGDQPLYVPFNEDNKVSIQPRELSVDVTPAPTLCSSYQAQLGSERSGLSVPVMSRSIDRNSVSSCQTHRLDLYQPPDPQEEKQQQLKLKIAVALIIIGTIMLIATLIALIIEDPLDII